MRLTLPQVREYLKRRGRMLWVRDRHHVEAAFVNVSDEPGAKGEPSGVDRIIQRWEDLKAGREYVATLKERRRQYAFRIHAREWLGDPDAVVQTERAPQEPIANLTATAARGILAWARDGLCPDDVYASEILHILENLEATVKRGG